LNITPIFDKGIDNGAVVHFTTIQQIDKMESQVKIEFYNKGHFAKYHFTDIIGESEMMVKARKLAEKFAKYNSNVLLYGESGCGKELFAQSIHNASLRSARPFVAVNCGALPSNLLESELFGYVEGAFTGALKKGKKGLFEIAHKGTIFLDEISEMDIKSQTRLLRVLEERVVMKIGDDRVIPIDVRVIAASNKNLLKLVKEGKFREDLYYRLNVLFLNVPPLRKRERDVLLIADSFMKQYGKKYNKWIVLNSEAEQEILSYPWEGNVRQLRNFCERLVIVADDKSISADVIREQLDIIDTSFSENDNDLAADLDRNIESMEDAEKRSIINALKKTGGNRTRTAEILGISKTTLWRKLKYYELE
jgi:Transcriptional regulator containing PAS, AAA-type ATPase, and DNA-binding domains